VELHSHRIFESFQAWIRYLNKPFIKENYDLTLLIEDATCHELRYKTPFHKRLSRVMFSNILSTIPLPIYGFITGMVKRINGLFNKRDVIKFEPNRYMRAVSKVLDDKTTPLVRLCLTHDIDTEVCAEFWPVIADIEQSYNMRSTFNVLTNGPYKLEKRWLDDLENRGFEIGLHGDTHDMSFGYRNPQDIEVRLRRCLDQLDRPILGYRAPAFAISEQLLNILDKLGFRYDSSIKSNVFYSGGVDICIPYIYPGTRIWELPLTIQDDGLFHDQALSDSQAEDVVEDIVNVLKPYNGVMIFNTHPSRIRNHLSFYRSLLTRFTMADVEITNIKDIIKSLDSHMRM